MIVEDQKPTLGKKEGSIDYQDDYDSPRLFNHKIFVNNKSVLRQNNIKNHQKINDTKLILQGNQIGRKTPNQKVRIVDKNLQNSKNIQDSLETENIADMMKSFDPSVQAAGGIWE